MAKKTEKATKAAKASKSDRVSNDFLVRHGEKIGFGVAFILLAVFVWLGLRTPRYEATTPVNLYKTAAEKARDHINNPQSWTMIGKEREAETKAAERISNEIGKLNPADYPYGPMLGAIFATLEKRSDPKILAVQDFRTEFIRTQVAATVPDGSRERDRINRLAALPRSDELGLEGMRYWMFAYRPDKNNLNERTHLAVTQDIVVGIGLIPFAEQKKLYRQQFFHAEGWHPLRDQPVYRFLQIQRSDDGGQTWKDINSAIDRYMRLNAKAAPEVIDNKYVLDDITFPIPPLLSFDYREIVGHDRVPFARLMEETPKPADAEDEGEKRSMFDEELDAAATADMSKSKKEPPPYRLARFFDPTPKQVGKTYQYRIRAWLVDPNSPEVIEEIKSQTGRDGPGELAGGGGGVGIDDAGPSRGGQKSTEDDPEDYMTEEEKKAMTIAPAPIREVMLAKSVRDRLRQRRSDFPEGKAAELSNCIPTPWSEISEVKISERYSRFYAGNLRTRTPVAAQDGINFMPEEYEPAAKIVAVVSDPNLDVSIPLLNVTAYRGAVINFNAVGRFLHPITWEVKELHEYVDSKTDYKNDRRIQIRGNFHQTDSILVDFLGGERMPFSSSREVVNKPTEMLIMDSTGRLIVRNELNDAANFRISTFMGDDPESDAEERQRREAAEKAEKDKKKKGGGGDDLGR
ncbi:MAG TPA: hypothetical protein PKD64_06070 [Pirellulaceae bacterium]|nr:hypothetical protein [Pirellulaceae bacterium]HMO91746.1 hypothetical protein [Pirellulaceae bacterium]HMP69791.1 hypothetical protein [Pirellulaceae bacterium]